MAYSRKWSKKYAPVRGKGGYRRRRATTKARGYGSGKLDKYVEAKVKRIVRQEHRGYPRSVPVQLKPALFNREKRVPDVCKEEKWKSYFQGPSSGRKYALLPVTELVQPQCPPGGERDDRFRSNDTVYIKGVCIRMTISHAESVRLLVFAFRNAMRRDLEPNSGNRPFVDGATVSDEPTKGRPTTEVLYEVMSKEQLMGISDEEFSFRNLGVHDGPFDVARHINGKWDWKGQDLTAFTSRFSKNEGGPIGEIYAKIDGGKNKKQGRTFSKQFSSLGLMRTNAFDGQNPNVQGWTGSVSRQVEMYIKLNRREKFTVSNGSSSVNERPIEIFFGFDTPGALKAAGSTKDIASAAITAMDMEVYYE